jgi:hypothetical protein
MPSPDSKGTPCTFSDRDRVLPGCRRRIPGSDSKSSVLFELKILEEVKKLTLRFVELRSNDVAGHTMSFQIHRLLTDEMARSNDVEIDKLPDVLSPPKN